MSTEERQFRLTFEDGSFVDGMEVAKQPLIFRSAIATADHPTYGKIQLDLAMSGHVLVQFNAPDYVDPDTWGKWRTFAFSPEVLITIAEKLIHTSLDGDPVQLQLTSRFIDIDEVVGP